MADSKNIIAATIPASGAAVFVAPLGTALPTDATTALASEYVDLGWVSEDGVTNSIKRTVTRHKAWGGETVKTTQDDYTETVKLALLESNAAVLGVVFGEDQITDAADALTVEHSSLMNTRQTFVIDFIDGDRNGRIVIKEGLVTEIDDAVYVHKNLLSWGITIDTYKPADGSVAVVQYFDKGAAAVAPASQGATGGQQADAGYKATSASVTVKGG